jgi:transketolase
VASGAYVLADASGPLELILIATGSELGTAVQAYEALRSEGIRCRVVSMPSWDLFEQQSAEYRESVLPSSVTRRLAIEQGSTLGWDRYVGQKGRVIGMHTFGASAPLKALQSHFGFDLTSILQVAREILKSG